MVRKLKTALASYYLLPIALTFALVCWTFGVNTLCLCTLAVLVGVILCFADDTKNAFPLIFFVSLFIKDIILAETNWVLYAVCIGFAGVSVFFRTGLIIFKKKFVKGKLFYPLIVFDLAFLLGGIVGNFNFTAMLATFGLSLAILSIYVIALSSTCDFAKFLIFAFISGAIFATLQHSMYGGMFGSAVYNFVGGNLYAEYQIWANSASPNTTALYIGLGAVSFLAFGYKKKFDYLCLLGCFLCIFGILQTNCRGMMLYITVVALPFIVLSFVKTGNKLKYGLAFVVSVGIVILLVVLLDDTSVSIIDKLIEKMSHGGSGREQLWPWCIEKFKSHPVFGYGFISPNPVPSLRAQQFHYIMAHNTLLQWLTSTGIVGIILSGWFYFSKYSLCLDSLKTKDFGLVVIIILIALSGLTEQAAAMDPFVFTLPILVLAALEKSTGKPEERLSEKL